MIALTDTWIKATWQDYLISVTQLQNEKAKSYYYSGRYKLEMTPLGFDHGSDHYIIILAVSFFAIYHKINFKGIDNCSYRREGSLEAQPDISYYLGNNADLIPSNTSIVDLNQYPPPDLVVEIAKSSLSEDLGNKRLLYEDLGIAEYWVVDVENAVVLAFAVSNRGSRRLETSQVFPGLAISLLNEALLRSRQSNHGVVGQWLMEQFQQSDYSK